MGYCYHSVQVSMAKEHKEEEKSSWVLKGSNMFKRIHLITNEKCQNLVVSFNNHTTKTAVVSFPIFDKERGECFMETLMFFIFSLKLQDS